MNKVAKIGGPLRPPVGAAKAVNKQLPSRAAEQKAEDDEIPSEISEALSILRQASDDQNLNMEYRYDRESGEVYVTIDDGKKGQKIRRQVSKEELLRLARLLQAGRRQMLDQLA